MNNMNKYYKNMILCSELDYHCLLCEESFEDIKEVEKHIRWETHRQNIKNPMCVRNYKENSFIYKIRDFFYCEGCNSVVKVLKEHTNSGNNREHKRNLEMSRLSLGTRINSGLIKFARFTLNRLQWHGIVNDKCSLCNTMVENVNDHINSTKHMVNIIQSEVSESPDNCFREMDKGIYCFNCTKVITDKNDMIDTHSCKKGKENKGLNLSKNNLQKEYSKSPMKLKPLAESKKDINDINIQVEALKSKIGNVLIDPTSKSKHGEIYHDDSTNCFHLDLLDHGKLRSKLAMYGKENFIKLNEGGSKGYCSLCNIYISAHMKIATQHVNGRLHKGHLELKGLIAKKRHTLPGYRVQSLQNFLKHIFHVPPVNAFCINFAITVNIMSFMFITEVENGKQPKNKCFCCDMVLKCSEVREHCKTKKHMKASVASDILLMDNEFIRIIRPGLFHCGFCNKVFPFWETMDKHLKSWEHCYAKKCNEVACTVALDWYAEHERSGPVSISDELYQHLINSTMI
ncbi:uncharacterized protein [Epargyreus clarus]|uniref:uncharacterized protein n=1 Tax=Epargyreus clarus TaxID=520877 RepID=UPI003C2C3381